MEDRVAHVLGGVEVVQLGPDVRVHHLVHGEALGEEVMALIERCQTVKEPS